MSVDRSDEGLMARVAAGDSAALGRLYDSYGSSVYALAMRVLHDRSLAEEVVQETFLRVWRQAASYRSARGLPGAWILSIARNLTIDELRRRGSRPQDTGDDPEGPLSLVPAADDPVEAAYASMRHDVVTHALEQLPPEQRTVLELAYFNGLSQSEIAARLGDPLGTVKTRMRLGLQKLKTLLNPYDVGVEVP